MHAIAETTAVYTPHPITLDGQRHETLHDGETIQQFLDRVAEDAHPEKIEVKLSGSIVPPHYWPRVKPKRGQMLEVRGKVGKQALYIVAMVALIYFTGGFGGGVATSGGIFGTATGAGTFYGMSAGLGASLAAAGTVMAGAAIGGRVIK